MRSFFIIATSAVCLLSSAALTQQPNQGSEALPNFSGVWGQPYVPAFEAPESGPVPVVNKSRRRQVFGVDGNPIAPGADAPVTSNTQQFVGDYTNPILKPIEGGPELPPGLAKDVQTVTAFLDKFAGFLGALAEGPPPDDLPEPSRASRFS